jgi:hypothetical protein
MSACRHGPRGEPAHQLPRSRAGSTIGCHEGHAAGDSGGVSAAMKQRALKFLQRTTSLFEKVFRDLGEPPMIARVKANLFVNSWRGAVVIAGAGEGLEHLRKVFRDLKESVSFSC